MYPNNIDKFTEKLNKIDGNTYVIEEEVNLKDGVYEGELEHDNVSSSSVRVYTGLKLTGEKLENFILSTPSTTPWKTIIRLYGNVDKAYITYETPGDTVEAEDINKVQESIVNTQKALNSEVERATKSEENINKGLEEETVRAKNAEKILTDSLNSEINRAKSAEEKLTSSINETNRNVSNEITRAKASEQSLLDSLNLEINRSKTSEKTLTDNLNVTNNNLNNEITRAKAAEKVMTDNLNTTNNNLSSEVTRAKSAETTINNELSSYKATNNAEIQGLKAKDTDLENKKANKTYVDTELNKRYLKDQVFTKEEALQKIKEVIGVAPEALDTLQEIAKALNNDADFAGTMTNELSKKVDKVVGKQLSTEDYTTAEKNKLAGVEQGANKYIHPSTHSADIIVENVNKRFVSDTEKANWNDVSNKVDKVTGKGLSTNDFDNSYKGKLDGISIGATKVENSSTNGNIKINGTEATVYTHPSGTNPHGTTKSDVGLSNVDNVKQATKTEFDAHVDDNVKHITVGERTTWNSKANASHTHDDRYYTETELNSKFATKEELGNTGHGDMLKTVYDKNNNGKVDVAEAADSVPWAGVTGKPSSFNPSTHTHSKAQITDFPSSLPANGGNADTVDGKHASDFLLKATKLTSNTDFNNITAEGIYYNPANAEVATMKNVPTQQALTLIVLPNAGCTQIVVNYLNNDERIYIRNMYSNNWGSWKQIAKQGDSYLKSESDSKYMKKGSVIWNDLKGV